MQPGSPAPAHGICGMVDKGGSVVIGE